MQYENQILKSELEAEHFILTQMAELGKVRNVRECQVAINNLLEKIGHFTKADRAYIVDEKDGCYYNTYEWCNEGIEPQINQLQNLRAEDMPYWIPKLSSGESIFIEDLENVKETMPVEYEILKPQNIHTLIVFPIILSNTLKGFIGVDNPNIKDAKDVIRLLAALGSYLGTTRENAAVYAKLEYRLNYDSLTKAYNRYGFYKNAQKLIKEHTDTEYCLILSDIKSFKLINEIYGENIADKILIDEVNIIRQKMKGNSVLGRLNGDIIAMVIPKEYLSEKEFSDMIKLLSDRYSNKNFRLHIYLGVYYIKDVNETIRQMVDKVSLVIMKSKGNMSNYILYYDENSYRNDIFKQQLIGEFETALNENQFCMYLQPQTDKDGNLIYLYANNKDEQYSYIEAAKNKGYNVLLMGGQLDVAMVSMLEQKFEKVRFTRVDSDVVDNLIVKEDKAKDVLEADKQEVLSVIFKSQLPQIEKTEFNVMAQALGENASPVMITQSEYMRRMKEMANIQAGMSFYGEMPDMFNLVLNADHKLVKEILADEDKECAAAVAPIQKEMDDVNTRRNELKKKQEGKKDEDIPTTEKDEVNDLDKKWEDLKNRKNGLFADYAAQNKVVRQLIDLALLQNGMLKGEALNNFVKRSIDLIK